MYSITIPETADSHDSPAHPEITLAHFSAETISRFQASFQALNEAIKQRAENHQQATPD